MWTDKWEPNKYRGRDGIGPKHWWRSGHASGYSVGEIDAGHYMARTPTGDGVIDDTGEYVSFSSPEDAKAYVERLVVNLHR